MQDVTVPPNATGMLGRSEGEPTGTEQVKGQKGPSTRVNDRQSPKTPNLTGEGTQGSTCDKTGPRTDKTRPQRSRKTNHNSVSENKDQD